MSKPLTEKQVAFCKIKAFFLEDPSRWTTHADARTKDGRGTSPNDINAIQFCFFGAANKLGLRSVFYSSTESNNLTIVNLNDAAPDVKTALANIGALLGL